MKLEIIWWLEPLIDYLWEHKKELLAQADAEDDEYINFGYPHYCGLPKKMHNELWEEHVYIIQENLYCYLQNSEDKKTFVDKMCLSLTRDTIKLVK